jgi:hypothetical protein
MVLLNKSHVKLVKKKKLREIYRHLNTPITTTFQKEQKVRVDEEVKLTRLWVIGIMTKIETFQSPTLYSYSH